MKKTSEKGKAWLKREMRPYRASIVFITFLSVLTTLTSLAFAYLVQFLVNGAVDKNTNRILVISCVLLGVLLLKIFSQVYYSYQSEKIRSKMMAEQRTKVYGKILRSNYAAVSAYHSGDLVNRVTSDVSEVVVDTVGLGPTLVGMAVQCVGAIAALLSLDPIFTAIYVVCGLLGGGLMALFRKKVKAYHKEFMAVDGESKSFMQEGIASLLTIKAYSAEDRVLSQTTGYSNRYYQTRMKRNVLRTFMSILTNVFSNVGLIFAVIWCSIRLLGGEIFFGEMLSVVLLLNQLQHPFSAVSGVVPVIFSRQASAERLDEISSLNDEWPLLSKETIDYSDLSSIDFKEVSFDYGREKVLKDVTISVNTDKVICIVGNSGSGKSTLFKLLLGVYQPTSGVMNATLRDGGIMPYNAVSGGLFAYVPQGNFLFTGTIRENLEYFADGILSEDAIRQAISVAQAEFIYELPNGLDTLLTERGGGLSEGQQQRLAIARALLSSRPILLLDEATSALDSKTEQRFLSAMKQLEGKTCIMVTHRPAALAIADTVYEVLDGEVVQRQSW